MNTVIILKRETSKSYQNQNSFSGSYKPVSGMMGFLLKIEVSINSNIDSNIFVMQRDVNSEYAQDPIDTFYSIASVGELEYLPIASPDPNATNFFRTNSIELMFESPKELEDAWIKISTAVLSLAEANDSSINTSMDLFAAYPSDAIEFFWGQTKQSTPNESDIKLLSSENSNYFKAYKINNTESDNYFVFCYPSFLPEIEVYVNSQIIACNYSLINITTKYGLQIEHRLYTTASMLINGILTVEPKKI